MKTRIIILGSLALILIFGSYMFVKRTQEAYAELTQKLKAGQASLEVNNLVARYQALNQRLEEDSTHEELRLSLLAAYSGYIQTSFIIEESNDLLLDSVAVIDDATGTITTPDELEKNTRFWMGVNPAAHENAGNGRAYYLHKALNGWISQLRTLNKKFKIQTAEGELFLPKMYEYRGGKSWEAHSFEGPLVANMAQLEALKYQVNETFSKELAFIELKLPSHQTE